MYVDLLVGVASLSNLFSESVTPYLNYRAMENVFCSAFEATDYSRSDVSADAGKDGIGIGLKTFLEGNGRTFQKVAEFNREASRFRGLTAPETAEVVSLMRNRRIQSTKEICGVHSMMYHLVTRSPGRLAIYEEAMDEIQIDRINVTRHDDQSIHFNDGLHEYSFSTSKSTLLKRFYTPPQEQIFGFEVEVLEDPFDLLLKSSPEPSVPSRFALLERIDTVMNEEVMDYIVLPLYSSVSGRVQERAGLNQWNAQGRARHEDEVYIPIPRWIHDSKPAFFPYRGRTRGEDGFKSLPFDVQLPNGTILSMRTVQAGGKALMSHPNSALGNWLLRDVLRLEARQLVSREDLDAIGIDSVKLSLMRDGSYTLDFLKSGSFETFEDQFRLKR